MAICTLARELKKVQYNIFDISTNSLKNVFNSLLNATKLVPIYILFNSGSNLMNKMQRVFKEAEKSNNLNKQFIE